MLVSRSLNKAFCYYKNVYKIRLFYIMPNT